MIVTRGLTLSLYLTRLFLVSGAGLLVLLPPLYIAAADGMPEGPPIRRAPKVKSMPVVREVPPPQVTEMRRPLTDSRFSVVTEECEWKFRLSAGVANWFFKEENNLSAPSLAADLWRTDIPINFRVGVEGRHMYLAQDAADFARETPEKTTRVTYLRIPLAVEYIQPITEDTNLYLGGGPDIIHTANDLTETNVGGHLGARIYYGFTENVGISVEGGYMWGYVDGQGENISLDNAYVTPAIAYTF